MPKGQRTFKIPENQKEQEAWEKKRTQAAKFVFNDKGEIHRPQIDTWAVIDEWGFTPEEFRLLYCIARHEKWKNLAGGGGRKVRLNGCYASAAKLSTYTGISRNKIFEILKLFQEAKVLQKQEARSRTAEKRGKSRGSTLAGWTYEYTINPITDWLPPWELAETREQLKRQKTAKKQIQRVQQSQTTAQSAS